MKTHFTEGGEWPTTMSQNDTDNKIRQNYEENVAAVARLMDHIDSCYDFFNDEVYAQQISQQISDPMRRYPIISLEQHNLTKPLSDPPSYPVRRRPLVAAATASAAEKEVPKANSTGRQGQAIVDAQGRSRLASSINTSSTSHADTIAPVGLPVANSSDTDTEGVPFASSVTPRRAMSEKRRSSETILPTLDDDEDDGDQDVKPVIHTSGIVETIQPVRLKSAVSAGHSGQRRTVAVSPGKPRPRRQASLRVSEFVRAEAALNGGDFDQFEAVDASASGIKQDVADDEDIGYGGIFGDSCSAAVASDDGGVTGELVDGHNRHGDDDDVNASRVGGDSALDGLPGAEDALAANAECSAFSCLYCDRTFMQADAMEDHIMADHVYGSVVTARSPSKPMKTIAPVRTVARSSPKDTAGSRRGNPVRAPPGKVVTIESLVATHYAAGRKRTKAGRRQLCMLCKKTFSCWSQLKKHLPIHSSEKPFKCPYEGCSYASVQKGNLKVHILGIHVRKEGRLDAQYAMPTTADSCAKGPIEISLQ